MHAPIPQPQKQQSQQKVFNNQFVVNKKISSGSFGVVFLGYDRIKQEDVAIKVEKEENEEVKSLEREVAVLNRLKGADGVPNIYWSGEEQDYNVVVVELLGKDLAFHLKTNKKFSLKTVIQIGDQLVRVLENIHIKGVIHRDLKPENILMGRGDNITKIYLVDFGISKIYKDSQNRHINFKDNKPFIGTTRYASIAAHKGYELGRKDDLESLIYVLLFFLKGVLPWQNLQNVTDEERTVKVGEIKQKIDLSVLCKDLPKQFMEILEYLKKLQFKNEPDYQLIICKFQEIADQSGIVYDNIYDWTECHEQQQQFNKTQTMEVKIEKELHKTTTIQQLGVPSPGKPKILRQASSNVNLNNQNFLLPPDPRNAKTNLLLLGRQDSRSITHQNSVLGTLNSMQINYQRSQAASDQDGSKQDQEEYKTKENPIELQKEKEKNPLFQTKSLQQAEEQQVDKIDKKLMTQSVNIPSHYNDTYGFKEFDIEENYEDVSLAQRYIKLKELQVANASRVKKNKL